MKNLLQTINKYLFKHPAIRDIAKGVLGSKIITNSKAYQNLILNKAKELNNREGAIFTNSICIETTLNCNSRCVMCAHCYNKMNGTMSMELFQKIIDDCVTNNIKTVSLSVYGEPFMDPNFFKRIEYLRSKGLTYTFISNGSLMSPEKIDRLFALGGLLGVWFSVNGFYKSTYEKVMEPLKRETSYNNILALFQKRKRLGITTPTVTISCVKTKWLKRGEVGKLTKFWKQAGAESIITGELWPRMGGLSNEFIQKEIGNLSKVHSKVDQWKSPCRALWGEFQVFYDGRVGACCFDADRRRLILGDLNTQTLGEIKQGKVLQGLRKSHLCGNRSKHAICGSCTYNGTWFE